MTRFSTLLSVTALLAAALPISPAHAAPPRDVDDLVGARGSSGENALQSRGYRIAKQNGLTNYWWNSAKDQCIRVITYNGRYDAIDSASDGDCGHGGGNTAAAAVAGVAAIGLIAALASHKKSHGDSSAQHDSEYERGYHDGLYGGDYDRNDSEAYHSGFSAGNAERSNRLAANSQIVRGAPAAAQRACARRGDEFQNVPAGSSVPVSVYPQGGDRYEIIIASGHYRSRCTVTGNGNVMSMDPY